VLVPIQANHFPLPPPHDEAYWICRCEGFRVDSATGDVGLVIGLRYGSRVDRPDWLVIRGRRFGRRWSRLVPVEQIRELRVAERRIVLAVTPAAGAGSRF
jgi:hypothetical protein